MRVPGAVPEESHRRAAHHRLCDSVIGYLLLGLVDGHLLEGLFGCLPSGALMSLSLMHLPALAWQQKWLLSCSLAVLELLRRGGLVARIVSHGQGLECLAWASSRAMPLRDEVKRKGHHLITDKIVRPWIFGESRRATRLRERMLPFVLVDNIVSGLVDLSSSIAATLLAEVGPGSRCSWSQDHLHAWRFFVPLRIISISFGVHKRRRIFLS